MNKDDVKMMIVSENRHVTGGGCTTSFSFALELWCKFLGVT